MDNKFIRLLMTVSLFTNYIIIPYRLQSNIFLILSPRSLYAIRRIGLFGSIVSNTHTNDSDIDLFIEFERPIGFKFIELVEYLENLSLGYPEN